MKVLDFLLKLRLKFGVAYANDYFDRWFAFWLTTGDEFQYMDGWRYDLFHIH